MERQKTIKEILAIVERINPGYDRMAVHRHLFEMSDQRLNEQLKEMGDNYGKK